MIKRKLMCGAATIVALAGLAFAACTSKTVGQSEENEASPPKITYGGIILPENSDYLIVPVNLGAERGSKLEILSGERTYEGGANLYNLIFYNRKDGSSHLLLDKKAAIASFDILSQDQKDSEPTLQRVLYRIIEVDTNEDGSLNNQDAVIGYLSDLSGKTLTQVTPNDTQLLSWQVDEASGSLFLHIQNDSDSNQQFTAKDSTTILKVDLEKPAVGNAIIPDKILTQLESILKE